MIIVTTRPQGFDTEVWGDWDSVSCYACGLAAVDPVSMVIRVMMRVTKKMIMRVVTRVAMNVIMTVTTKMVLRLLMTASPATFGDK